MKAVEGELGLLKNQIQQTLLDIREHVLELSNPFGSASRSREWDSRPAAAAEPTPVVTTVLAAPPPPEPVVETPEPPVAASPEPEPPAETPPALESFDALFDAPPAPGLDGPTNGMADSLWDDTPPPAPEPPKVSTSPRAHHEPQSPAPGTEPPMEKGSKIDLITLTSLVKWVDQTTRKIGKERVMVILDIYEMAGRIAPSTKQLVQRLCALSDGSSEHAIPLREVVGAMLQIDGLLEAKQMDERRMLSLLMDDTFDPFQGLAANRNGNY